MEILSYFLRNPRAIDSVEGIAQWRLLDETIHRNVREVAEALEWLVEQGFVMRKSLRSGPPVFSLNLRKATTARHLVTTAKPRLTHSPE
jgi:hypothetical protein